MAVFMRINPSEHGPAVRISRILFDRMFESVPGSEMFLGNEPLVIAEPAQERLIRSQLVRGLTSD